MKHIFTKFLCIFDWILCLIINVLYYFHTRIAIKVLSQNTMFANIHLWVDDERPAPQGWVWAKTALEAITVLKSFHVSEISMDHDLGDVQQDGSQVTCYILEQAYMGNIPKMEWHIHSQNPVGAQKMQWDLEKADSFWEKNGQI